MDGRVNGFEKFGKKRRQWEDSGVHELIKLWKCCAYELRTIKRNGHLYVAMAKQLSAIGVPVSALEVHFKVNNLTQRYRQESKTYETTGIVSTWKFYSLVDDVFKSLSGHTSNTTGFKTEKRVMTPASNASSISDTSVWKNSMSEPEFTNNSEPFYKTEYMQPRHYMEPSSHGNSSTNPPEVPAFMNNPRMNESNINPMTPSVPNGADDDFVGRLAKIKKNDDYDKLVDIVKNIVDNYKTGQPDKVDSFTDFLKSYLRKWPDRMQDEAINHITNYMIVKNMEHTISSAAANRQ